MFSERGGCPRGLKLGKQGCQAARETALQERQSGGSSERMNSEKKIQQRKSCAVVERGGQNSTSLKTLVDSGFTGTKGETISSGRGSCWLPGERQLAIWDKSQRPVNVERHGTEPSTRLDLCCLWAGYASRATICPPLLAASYLEPDHGQR